jgi:hypothetical protein
MGRSLQCLFEVLAKFVIEAFAEIVAILASISLT